MATFLIPGLNIVTIPTYQWTYVAGRQFGVRNEGATEFGVAYRQVTGTVQRVRTLRFVQTDAVIEALRTLSMRAGRRALPVIFTDNDGQTWTVDWQQDITFTQVVENRREVELTLIEQSPGL